VTCIWSTAEQGMPYHQKEERMTKDDERKRPISAQRAALQRFFPPWAAHRSLLLFACERASSPKFKAEKCKRRNNATHVFLCYPHF